MINIGLWLYIYAVLQFKRTVTFVLKNEEIEYVPNRIGSCYISRRADVRVKPGGHGFSKNIMIENKDSVIVIEPYKEGQNNFIPNHFVSKNIPMFPFLPNWIYEPIGIRLIENISSWVQYGGCVVQKWTTGKEIDVTEVWRNILRQILNNNQVIWSPGYPCQSGLTDFLSNNKGLTELETIKTLDMWVSLTQERIDENDERPMTELNEQMRAAIVKMVEEIG